MGKRKEYVSLEEMKSKLSPAEIKFEQRRREIGLFLGPLVALLILVLGNTSSLSPDGRIALAITAWTIIWWICEPLPIPVVSFLPLGLTVVCGIYTWQESFASLGHQVNVLLIGAMILVAALDKWGLLNRIALYFLASKWVGESPFRLIVVFGLVTAVLSSIASNVAVTIIMLGLALGVFKALELSEESKYFQSLLLVCAWAAGIGGIGTLVGTPPNLLGVGLASKTLGLEVGFLKFSLISLPCMFVSLFLSFALVKFLMPAEISAIPKGKDYLRAELEKLGKMSWGAKWSLLVFILAFVLWFLPGLLALVYGEKSAAVLWSETHLETSSIAMLLAVLLLAVPVDWKEKKFALTWGEANKGISWGTILLIAGGITMGGSLVKTGVAKWVGDVLISAIPNATPLVITLTCALLAYVLTQFCSNIASIMVVGPIAISFAQAAGINPLQSLMAVTLTVSMAFVLPISTPPNAIVYGSGYLKMVSFLKGGLVVSFIVSLVTAVMAHFITGIIFPM